MMKLSMSRALKSEQKEAIATLVLVSTDCVANWLWEKLDTSGVGSRVKEIMTGKPSSVVVGCPLQRTVHDQME